MSIAERTSTVSVEAILTKLLYRCLTDCYFENGATLFIPGSHKWTTKDEVPEVSTKRSLVTLLLSCSCEWT